MKVTRIIILAVALGAGLLAALLMRGMMGQEPVQQAAAVAEQPMLNVVEVLVASEDIQIGSVVDAARLTWRQWPKSSVSDHYITKSSSPDATSDLAGTIARAPFLDGEPIKESKLIRSDRGFMSAILPKGKRAVAVEVRAVSTAGGFILPNDRVDIILTRQTQRSGSGESHISETILENVRILAIDQTLAEKDGEKTVVAQETATVELGPAEAEILAQAAQVGTISLSLRSIADSQPDSEDGSGPSRRAGVNMVKYGVRSRSMARQ